MGGSKLKEPDVSLSKLEQAFKLEKARLTVAEYLDNPEGIDHEVARQAATHIYRALVNDALEHAKVVYRAGASQVQMLKKYFGVDEYQGMPNVVEDRSVGIILAAPSSSFTDLGKEIKSIRKNELE